MIKEKDIISQSINVLRFLLVVIVVYIHAFPLNSIPYKIDWGCIDGMSLYNLVRVYVSLVVGHIAVPVFFLMSGLLFFNGLQEWNWTVYKRKIISRFRSLAVPYISWICVALFIGICMKIGFVIHHRGDLSEIMSWMNDNITISSFWDYKKFETNRLNWLGIQVPASAPYLVPLWFVRDLMVLALLSPFMFPLLRVGGGKCGVLLLLFLYVSQIWPYFPGFDIGNVFFFAFGGWLTINQKDVVGLFCRGYYVSVIVAAILSIILVFYYGNGTFVGNKIYPFFVLSGVIAAVGFVIIIVKKGEYISFIDRCLFYKDTTFFIFASHSIILSWVVSFLYIILPHYWISYIFIFLFAPIVIVMICIWTYYFVRKHSNMLFLLLTGGR